MSKIGRKPIPFKTAKIEINDNVIKIDGAKAHFIHELPSNLVANLEGKNLLLKASENTREARALWGLHRALLANKVKGVETGFERKVSIVGLGFKAQAAGQKMTFTLGYTHKIDYDLPTSVSVEIDKSGQNLVFKSSDRFALGNVCDTVQSFRPPEPYKGKGIILEGEVIIRKAGKTKSK